MGGLGTRHGAGALGIAELGGSHDLARRMQPVGQLAKREVAEPLVVAGLGARLGEQRRGGRAAAGHREQVAGERDLARPALAGAGRAERDPLERRAALGLQNRGPVEHVHASARQLIERVARGFLAQVGHGGQLHAVVEQGHGRLEPAVVDRGHHGAAAGAEAVERGQAHGAAGEHHAGQVVAGEQQRLLDRPGGVDDLRGRAPGGACRPARPARARRTRRARALRTAPRRRASRARAASSRACSVAALGEQAPAGLRALVGQHHVGAQLGGRDRRAEARRAAPDHEHVRVAAPVLGAPLALLLVLAQLPEPGGVAQHLLVQRPQPPRADEGLVVEAGRREGPAEEVGGAHGVELERRAGVHVLDAHALAQRLGAGAHAGGAVHLHEAVGALAGAAHEAAAAVVLEAAREGAPPPGVTAPSRSCLPRAPSRPCRRS